MLRVLWVDALDDRRPLIESLDDHVAVGIRGALAPVDATELAERVLRAEQAWTRDFDGEQFALGRAFYTHLETGRAKAYFDSARQSDTLVEQTLPGVQTRTLDLLGRAISGKVRRRPGFCGPGVHIFPPHETVGEKGGVVHYDLEGLTDQQVARRARAVTLVWMLLPPTEGGGLRVFDAIYDGRPDTQASLIGHSHTTVLSNPGDALIIDSYRLHQIRPFTGATPRISITVHAVEVDRNVWEAWF